jgi:hypothetical protein
LKVIKFVPEPGFENLLAPTPIKNHIPEWYKNAEIYDNEGIEGLKTCMPFLDAMVSGYALTTWEDLIIIQQDETVSMEDIGSMVNERFSSVGSTIPRPHEYLNNHFAWSGKWGIKVPDGYSIIITHPFNRLDLPFTTVSGIIDSDTWIPAGNIPFFLQKGFNGLIPKGTPFAHVFPYKRESWQMEVLGAFEPDKFFSEIKNGSIKGYYKKKFWKRKDYK